MLKKCLFIWVLLFLVFSLPGASPAYPFGFFAHRKINRMAVFTLPPEMIGLYKEHIEFLAERSVDPDRRAHAIEGEAPRHYIDIDHYGAEPFVVMPKKWTDAVSVFSEDTLMLYGVLPWHIDVMMHRLTRAFEDMDMDRILLLSAHLGHYIADACTPLHTTVYYNGRSASQRGIHALWESRLPELYAADYDFFTGKAKYVKKPLYRAWELIKTSHYKVDSIYYIYDSLLFHIPGDLVYAHEMRGQSSGRVYSQFFSGAFHMGLCGMVERQMRLAVKTVGDFWFTAWVNAGQPDLQALETRQISQRLLRFLRQQENEWDQVTKASGRLNPP